MNLEIGDEIKILSIPGNVVHRDTRRAYRYLVKRKRPVKIYEIDEYGHPWYEFRMRNPRGKLETHFMNIMEGDDNWRKIKKRK